MEGSYVQRHGGYSAEEEDRVLMEGKYQCWARGCIDMGALWLCCTIYLSGSQCDLLVYFIAALINCFGHLGAEELHNKLENINLNIFSPYNVAMANVLASSCLFTHPEDMEQHVSGNLI